jgi:hypothetical protein
VEREVRADRRDDVLAERAPHPLDRALARRGPDAVAEDLDLELAAST